MTMLEEEFINEEKECDGDLWSEQLEDIVTQDTVTEKPPNDIASEKPAATNDTAIEDATAGDNTVIVTEKQDGGHDSGM